MEIIEIQLDLDKYIKILYKLSIKRKIINTFCKNNIYYIHIHKKDESILSDISGIKYKKIKKIKKNNIIKKCLLSKTKLL